MMKTISNSHLQHFICGLLLGWIGLSIVWGQNTSLLKDISVYPAQKRAFFTPEDAIPSNGRDRHYRIYAEDSIFITFSIHQKDSNESYQVKILDDTDLTSISYEEKNDGIFISSSIDNLMQRGTVCIRISITEAGKPYFDENSHEITLVCGKSGIKPVPNSKFFETKKLKKGADIVAYKSNFELMFTITHQDEYDLENSKIYLSGDGGFLSETQVLGDGFYQGFISGLTGNVLNKYTVTIINENGEENMVEIPFSIYYHSDNTERRGKDYAYIFAVDKYSGATSNLNTPIADADLLKKVLETTFDFEVHVFKNPDAEEFTKEMEKLKARSWNEHDQLLICFSGHGTSESIVFKGGDTNSKKLQTHIDYGILQYMIDRIKCRKILTIVDACKSGNFLDLDPTKGTTNEDILVSMPDVIEQLEKSTQYGLTAADANLSIKDVSEKNGKREWEASPFMNLFLDTLLYFSEEYTNFPISNFFVDTMKKMKRGDLELKPQGGKLNPEKNDGAFLFLTKKN